jgi:hypothetical protein
VNSENANTLRVLTKVKIIFSVENIFEAYYKTRRKYFTQQASVKNGSSSNSSYNNDILPHLKRKSAIT